MILEAIKNFPRQFLFSPRIENARRLVRVKKFIVCGMGGSNLTAGLLLIAEPSLNIIAHKDYGLPKWSDTELKCHLVIAVSYSGNTEETITGFQEARRKKLTLAAVATGGKLLALAKKYRVPYVQIPEDGIQPRMATGFQFKALASLMGLATLSRGAQKLAHTLNPAAYRGAGKRLAVRLKAHVPVIYASTRNAAIAYNWKIKFNETGKIPAFYNVLPELNHNEMTGFDTVRALSKPFHILVLQDRADHHGVQKRMQVLARLYRARRLPVDMIQMQSRGVLEKMFASLILADWTAYYIARGYKLEPEQVPMVEEFKQAIL